MYIPAPDYTPIPNKFFDVMPDLRVGELKVLMIVMSKIIRTGNSRVLISLREMKILTGLSERVILSSSASLGFMGLIAKFVEGEPGTQKTFYSLLLDIDDRKKEEMV